METHATKAQLIQFIHDMHQKGWSAATGTNYSYRLDSDTYMVTVSGIDKSTLNESDFMKVYVTGGVCSDYQHLKPSAENAIHAAIYRHSDAKIILHSHSVYATILSQEVVERDERYLLIQNYEVQKAINQIDTHEQELFVPVFPNTQNMVELSEHLTERWDMIEKANGFLIGNHGFYTWGRDLAEAKRHIEAYEFLFSCLYHKRLLMKG
jgi:methylthioribulose-1-phosphate dehydratase